MATPELRHMLRDDDLNHEEQKQVLELAIKFHKNRRAAGHRRTVRKTQHAYPFQLLPRHRRAWWLSAGHR